jgi:hypothetical protein
MALRFIVAGPLSLLVPPLQRRSEATSLAMNSTYRRAVDLPRSIDDRAAQLDLLVLWIPVESFLALGGSGPRAGGVGCRGVRVTLPAASHPGRARGLTRAMGGADRGTMGDSLDTPGAWWTTIWAPVGHRYHALHHYVPGLPYHNLGKAYRRLASRAQAGTALEHGTVRPSLWSSPVELWASAGGSRSGRS